MHQKNALARIVLYVVITVAFLAIAGPAAAALRVTVQPGQTLSGIAVQHGVSTAALVRANGISDVHMIVAGHVLVVPSARAGAWSGGGGSTSGTYTVRPGDTLSEIAARHGVSVGTIARANGLANAHMVVAGTRLRISGGSGVAASAATWVGSGSYTVQAGDTLASIAARYGTSAAALAGANGIRNPNVVVIGTRLRVRGGASATNVSRGSAAGGGYTVQPGENLGAIAARYGTTASALASANGIADPNMVVAGTTLRIPGGSGGSPGPSQGSLTPVTAATSGWGNHPSQATVADLMARSAARHGVDVSLVRAVGWQESGWWQGARSSTGAIGVMQLMPGTAEWLGPALLGRRINPYDVADNIDAGAAYLAYLQRQTGSQRLAIASYYQGLGSVSTRGLLAETESYVSSVSSAIGRV